MEWLGTLLENRMPKIALFSWLGHPARMSDNRMPKIALFSWLTTPRPCWGPEEGMGGLSSKKIW